MFHCTLPVSDCAAANTVEAKTPAKTTFGLEHVVGKARELAQTPFKDPFGRIPSFLLEINYDQWRNIRYKPEKSCGEMKAALRSAIFPPGLLLQHSGYHQHYQPVRGKSSPLFPRALRLRHQRFQGQCPEHRRFCRLQAPLQYSYQDLQG